MTIEEKIAYAKALAADRPSPYGQCVHCGGNPYCGPLGGQCMKCGKDCYNRGSAAA